MPGRKQQPAEQDKLTLQPVYLSARAALVQPDKGAFVTLYSLEKWMPRLGVERWALVQILRVLAANAARRHDGTKHVTITFEELAAHLQIERRTVGKWLAHEPIEGDAPWRRISLNGRQSNSLSQFIPRLRYAYTLVDGRPRRSGFIIEIVMEDPLVPEDQSALEQLIQAPTDGIAQANEHYYRPDAQAVKDGKLTSGLPEVTKSDFTKPQRRKVTKGDFTRGLKSQKVTSGGGKVTKSDSNVNELTKLTKMMNKTNFGKKNGREARPLLTPIVKLTEELLQDFHSTAMLYKVLQHLQSAQRLDLFAQAVTTAVELGQVDAVANRGAIFVANIKELAAAEGIDLKLGKMPPSPAVQPRTKPPRKVHAAGFKVGQYDAADFWQQTLDELAEQMPRSTFETWVRHTQPLRFTDGMLVVGAPNTYAVEWLENRLSGTIRRTAASILGKQIDVSFTLDNGTFNQNLQRGT